MSRRQGVCTALVVIVLVACNQRGAADATVQRDTTAIVAELAGCYELRSPSNRYVVQVLTTRSATQWDARLVEPPGAARDAWAWVPIDSGHFVIRWGGIDGTLSYTIEQQGNLFAGQETFVSGNTRGQMTRPIEVRRISC